MLLPAFSLKALPSRKKPLTGWLVPHLQRSLQASGEGEDAQLDKSQMRPARADLGETLTSLLHTKSWFIPF